MMQLTPAEQRVMSALQSGGSVAQTARRLGINPRTASAHVHNARLKLDPSKAELTDIETVVLNEVAILINQKAVARRLGKSRRTIEAHLFNIRRKLGVTSTVAAILAVRERQAGGRS